LRQRMAEADRKRKISAIKQQIRDLQSREAQAINALSAQVLALHEAGTLKQPELVSLCKGVDEVRAQIEEIEAELEALQPAQPEPPKPADAARCPKCSAPVVSGAAFCQTCGTRLEAEESPPPVLFCIHCGAQLRESARFCPKCGQTVPEGTAPKTEG
jgi:membrane protease subunit (stomatin/prohibitin family)